MIAMNRGTGRGFALSGCLLFGLLLPGGLVGQGEGARSYWKAPANTHSLGPWIMLLTGNASGFNTAVPVDGASIDTRVYMVNYTSFFNLFGRRNQASLTLPFGSLSGTTTGVSPGTLAAAAKGNADPTIWWAVNVLGAPAQTLAEYAGWEQRTILDAQVYVTAPLGSYDADELLNLGTNRWSVRFGLPFVQSIGSFMPGQRTTLELVPSLTLYTDNDQANRGTEVLGQDPLFKVEGHLTRDVTDKLWLSGDAMYTSGGETKIDGEPQDNAQTTFALGFTVGFELSEDVSFMGIWGNSLTDPEDGINMNMIWLRFSYHWNPTAQRAAAQRQGRSR
jgi:hypothetical protein